MIRIPKVTMTMRELDRLKCIQGLIDGHLKQHAVATRLGLTTRQVRRLVRQYQQQGPVGLISKLRDRPSNRRLKSEIAEHACGLLRQWRARGSTHRTPGLQGLGSRATRGRIGPTESKLGRGSASNSSSAARTGELLPRMRQIAPINAGKAEQRK